ncbi:MAG TPA: helix-turn-helix domain-containing protein [Candidatus Obscuribacterales bacterium]
MSSHRKEFSNGIAHSTSQSPVKTYTVDEFAQTVGISRTKAWKEIHQRRIAYVRLGRRILITQQQLDEYLKRNEVPAFDAKSAANKILRGSTK